MSMKAYDLLFAELDRCDFVIDYEYEGELEDYTYNGISYSRSSEFYFNHLEKMYEDFLREWSTLSEDDKNIALAEMKLLLDKRFISDEFFFDVPSIETVEAMRNDEYVPRKYVEMADFLYRMSFQQKFFLEQLKSFFNVQHRDNELCLGKETPMGNEMDNEFKGVFLPSLYKDDDKLVEVCNKLIDGGYLDMSTSSDDFVYFFSGRGKVPEQNLIWIGNNVELAFFVDSYCTKFKNDIPEKWKKAQMIFRRNGLRQALTNSLNSTKESLNKKRYDTFNEILELI